MSRSTINRRNGRTAFALLAVVGGMVGLAYASAPLYQMFCKVTGYGGTPKTEAKAGVKATERTITIQFDANVSPNLAWRFTPEQREITVKIGEQALATYAAESLSAKITAGAATYNVTPFKAGPYFDKVACFCFSEQTLQPGQKVSMPVTFYVDPDILNDPSTKDLKTITLSYTFFPALDADKKAGPTAGLDEKRGG